MEKLKERVTDAFIELREAVTENYWDSREHIDIMKREIQHLQEQLEQEQRMTRQYKRDFDYMWDEENHTDEYLWGIARRHGIDEGKFEGEE